MTRSNRVKEFAKGGLVLLGLALAFLLWIAIFTTARHKECDRLNEARVSHLEPGHETRGPGSVYVIGVGPGPPRSEISEYWDAEAAMTNAGCDVPGTD